MDIDKVILEIKKIVKEEGQKLPIRFQALIGAEMENSQVTEEWRYGKVGSKVSAINQTHEFFNKSNKLRNRTGKYLQSYIKDVTVTDALGRSRTYTTPTKVEVNDYGYKGTIGTNMGFLHENPKFISSKGKMAKFFWAVYMKTKNVNWKILALSAKRGGGVWKSVPQRMTFTPAKDKIDKNLMTLIESITDKLISVFNNA